MIISIDHNHNTNVYGGVSSLEILQEIRNLQSVEMQSSFRDYCLWYVLYV